ncbi:MFS general substrate transporter [Aspergillus steynii IBT 23096]|uniref:MFS general substrate transporter n=1 Tax=Aspergillus steynii IBT 23096 TaxID=1392250 RepID=A0A2I2GL59_9EURO|nr:MFS general substrate transporter [Aspergillus steynii IBT 23096]PLB53587.1 MFS general substrate transporter [Aspergillus steynii IBT 23096]
MTAAADLSAEAELYFIPGTVHLLDLQGHMNVRHAADHTDVVLVPAPSNHPDDPLNWSPRRKHLSAFCMALYVGCSSSSPFTDSAWRYVLVVGICASMLYSTLATLSKKSGLSVNNLNAGTGYMFLTYGWGCVLFQALALQYGKRPAYLISLLGTIAIMVWQPFITKNGEWIAAKLLQGLFGAPMESLAEISVSDVFFTHERGLYMAIYAMALAYSNNLAPLMMGFINDGQSLEWTFYWCAIFCGFALLFCFFFMEETNFPRSNITGQEEA